jgi:transposase
VRVILKLLVDTFTALEAQIAALDAEINQRSKSDPTARQLMTIPGVGPIVSTAIIALVPAAEGFPAGRDFAAWLGLTPLQKSTGGKQKLGAVSKRGERTIRRPLIIGASAWFNRRAPKGSWLAQMLARKPKMLVTVAPLTRWPASSGPCWSKVASTELRDRLGTSRAALRSVSMCETSRSERRSSRLTVKK